MIYQNFNHKKRKEINGPSAAVIRYDQEKDQSPTVIAHGKGMLANKIIELAGKNEIPIQEDSLLVENLIDMDLGENIPPQLYSVIAEIFLMLEEMEQSMNGGDKVG